MRHWKKLSDKAKYYVRCKIALTKDSRRVDNVIKCDLRIISSSQMKKHYKVSCINVMDKKHKYWIPNKYKK